MYRDRLIAAGLAGLLGIIPDMLIEYGSLWAGLARATTGMNLAGVIFMSGDLDLPRIIVGALAHLIAGGVLGPILLLMLS